MDKKMTGIVAYITWIGLIIAYFAGDREGAKFHLNQALVIVLANIVASVVAIIPIIGTIVAFVASIFLIVCWFIGLIAAIKEEEKQIPLIGGIQILK